MTSHRPFFSTFENPSMTRMGFENDKIPQFLNQNAPEMKQKSSTSYMDAPYIAGYFVM